MNKVPKPWYEKEVYCQLIPNDDDNNPYYDILPRIGAFEVSTVINNVDILFYSKQMSSMWPNATMLGKRIGEAMEDSKNMAIGALKDKWQTTGRQYRAPRQGRGFGTSSSKASLSQRSTRSEAAPVQAAAAEQQPEPVAQPAPVQEEVKQPEPEAAAQPEPAQPAPAQDAPAAQAEAAPA